MDPSTLSGDSPLDSLHSLQAGHGSNSGHEHSTVWIDHMYQTSKHFIFRESAQLLWGVESALRQDS